ncbi:unnamed protein product [Gordionus sp. m RMFG-2023]|uniref:uncharacterized protein LOC135930871 n=1 Tax=Gordionus sp. m RMFG-2023 TaxID=3053472 RepID=UPI0030E251E4
MNHEVIQNLIKHFRAHEYIAIDSIFKHISQKQDYFEDFSRKDYETFSEIHSTYEENNDEMKRMKGYLKLIIGYSWNEEGKYDEALKFFTVALDHLKDTSLLLCAFNISDICHNKDNLSTSINHLTLKCFQMLLGDIRRLPPTWNITNIYANALTYYGKHCPPHDFEVICLKALEFDPHNEIYLGEYGRYALNQALETFNSEQIKDWLSRLTKLKERGLVKEGLLSFCGSFYLAARKIFYTFNDWKQRIKALNDIENSKFNSDDYPETSFLLARTYYMIRDYEKAVFHLDRCKSQLKECSRGYHDILRNLIVVFDILIRYGKMEASSDTIDKTLAKELLPVNSKWANVLALTHGEEVDNPSRYFSEKEDAISNWYVLGRTKDAGIPPYNCYSQCLELIASYETDCSDKNKNVSSTSKYHYTPFEYSLIKSACLIEFARILWTHRTKSPDMKERFVEAAFKACHSNPFIALPYRLLALYYEECHKESVKLGSINIAKTHLKAACLCTEKAWKVSRYKNLAYGITLADYYLELGDSITAYKHHLESMARIVEDKPRDRFVSWVYRRLGILNLHLRKYDVAINYFNQVFHEDPEDIESWKGLGEAYFNNKSYKIALRAFQEALSHDDKVKTDSQSQPSTYKKLDQSYYNTKLARIYYRLGMHDKAIYELEQILYTKPGYLPAIFSLAQAYVDLCKTNLGKHYDERAVVYCQNALGLLISLLNFSTTDSDVGINDSLKSTISSHLLDWYGCPNWAHFWILFGEASALLHNFPSQKILGFQFHLRSSSPHAKIFQVCLAENAEGDGALPLSATSSHNEDNKSRNTEKTRKDLDPQKNPAKTNENQYVVNQLRQLLKLSTCCYLRALRIFPSSQPLWLKICTTHMSLARSYPSGDPGAKILVAKTYHLVNRWCEKFPAYADIVKSKQSKLEKSINSTSVANHDSSISNYFMGNNQANGTEKTLLETVVYYYCMWYNAKAILLASSEISRFAMAKDVFKSCVFLDKNNAMYWSNSAILNLLQDNKEDAKSIFKIAKVSDPSYASAWAGLAMIAYMEKKYEDALVLFEHCFTMTNTKYVIMGFAITLLTQLSLLSSLSDLQASQGASSMSSASFYREKMSPNFELAKRFRIFAHLETCADYLRRGVLLRNPRNARASYLLALVTQYAWGDAGSAYTLKYSQKAFNNVFDSIGVEINRKIASFVEMTKSDASSLSDVSSQEKTKELSDFFRNIETLIKMADLYGTVLADRGDLEQSLALVERIWTDVPFMVYEFTGVGFGPESYSTREFDQFFPFQKNDGGTLDTGLKKKLPSSLSEQVRHDLCVPMLRLAFVKAYALTLMGNQKQALEVYDEWETESRRLALIGRKDISNDRDKMLVLKSIAQYFGGLSHMATQQISQFDYVKFLEPFCVDSLMAKWCLHVLEAIDKHSDASTKISLALVDPMPILKNNCSVIKNMPSVFMYLILRMIRVNDENFNFVRSMEYLRFVTAIYNEKSNSTSNQPQSILSIAATLHGSFGAAKETIFVTLLSKYLSQYEYRTFDQFSFIKTNLSTYFKNVHHCYLLQKALSNFSTPKLSNIDDLNLAEICLGSGGNPLEEETLSYRESLFKGLVLCAKSSSGKTCLDVMMHIVLGNVNEAYKTAQMIYHQNPYIFDNQLLMALACYGKSIYSTSNEQYSMGSFTDYALKTIIDLSRDRLQLYHSSRVSKLYPNAALPNGYVKDTIHGPNSGLTNGYANDAVNNNNLNNSNANVPDHSAESVSIIVNRLLSCLEYTLLLKFCVEPLKLNAEASLEPLKLKAESSLGPFLKFMDSIHGESLQSYDQMCEKLSLDSSRTRYVERYRNKNGIPLPSKTAIRKSLLHASLALILSYQKTHFLTQLFRLQHSLQFLDFIIGSMMVQKVDQINNLDMADFNDFLTNFKTDQQFVSPKFKRYLQHIIYTHFTSIYCNKATTPSSSVVEKRLLIFQFDMNPSHQDSLLPCNQIIKHYAPTSSNSTNLVERYFKCLSQFVIQNYKGNHGENVGGDICQQQCKSNNEEIGDQANSLQMLVQIFKNSAIGLETHNGCWDLLCNNLLLQAREPLRDRDELEKRNSTANLQLYLKSDNSIENGKIAQILSILF